MLCSALLLGRPLLALVQLPLQADELLRYIAREKTEAEQESFVQSFSLDGDRSEVVNKLVGEVKDLGAGNEKGTYQS